MKIKIFKTENFKTSQWSAGSTTELFIYPKSADYQLRNFDFRLSTAKVEAEESNFTVLDGFSRKLMILEGEITIAHEGKYTRKLSKFGIDNFEGNWNTSSKGKCTDFNVMTSPQFKSKLDCKILSANQLDKIEFDAEYSFLFVYVLSGKIDVNVDTDTNFLKQSDLFVLEGNFNLLIFNTLKYTELIVVKIGER